MSNDLLKSLFSRTKEEVVSMFLGLAIVVVVFFLIINYISNRRGGNVDVPGITDNSQVEETSVPTITIAVEPTKEMVKEVQNFEYVEYVVKKGDSLWKIAEKKLGSGFRWGEIVKINNIENPRVLTVGKKLNLPKIETKDELTTTEKIKTIEGGEYVVVRNDNLSKIALMAYGDSYAWVKIWEANKDLIKDPSIIYSGWKLKIPR